MYMKPIVIPAARTHIIISFKIYKLLKFNIP